MVKWIKQKSRQIVAKALPIKPIWQRSRSRLRNRQAYKGRSRQVPRLLANNGIKAHEISSPRHLIFIVVDSMRKDCLSLYGYERDTTPFLKSLAKKAAVFENAVTPGPWTFPAVASILTGLYPHNHGAVHSQDPRNFDVEYPDSVHPDILSLPEVLAAFGFESNFISSIATAALPGPGWFKAASVFFAGAEQHLAALQKWLMKHKDKRTFTYLQLGDLHAPINAPEPYRSTFGQIPDIPGLHAWKFRAAAEQKGPNFELYRESRFKIYNCALHFVDSEICRFFDWLNKVNLKDCTSVFITSDHGDEFWDHMEIEQRLFYDPRGFHGVGHGHNLFQEIINVPLLFTGPGVKPGHFTHNVSLVDLVPTVLELYGIKHKLTLDGHSLFSCQEERLILSEGIAYGYEKKALLKNNFKLIHSEGDGVNLLFDLSQDSRETTDLAKTNLRELQVLKAALPKTRIRGKQLQVDKEIERQLQNLGYL